MKRHQNILLLLAVVLLAALPLWLVQKPAPDADGKPVEIFAGADDKARDLGVSVTREKMRRQAEQQTEPLTEKRAGVN